MSASLLACALGGAAATAQTSDVAAPTKLWAAQTALNGITLVWKLAPGATGYVLSRDAGGRGSAGEGHVRVAALAGNVSRYVYLVRGESPQPAQFYLEATDANGATSQKVAFNPVTMVTTPVAAVPPASVTAKETSPGVVTVTWTPSPGATAYLLGRVTGPNGLGTLCALCPTTTTYVDSGLTNGVRYQYSVIAITPSAVSLRTMSNAVTPGVVVATGGGTTGTGGSGSGGTGSGGAGTGGTGGGGTTGDTTPTATTASNPLRGRYRVTLTGFTVQSQTYDHPLQIDGKGDEVYLATQVMVLDTMSTNLVAMNEVRTSRVFGDISGFSYRVKAGTAGFTGGLATGNSFPPAGTTGKSLGDVPMVLWEGELVQGRSALVVVPTIWEWDDNPELFGNWLTGRHAALTRLLQPEPVAAILLNRDPQPIELGAGGLYVHTNMFGDARDRPIGLRPGQKANNAGFFAPLALDPKTGAPATSYASNSGSVVGGILGSSPFADFAKTLIERLFQIVKAFAPTLGTTNARVPLASSSSLPSALSEVVRRVRSQLSGVMTSQPAIALRQFTGVLAMANPSSLSSDLYLFEKMVVLTPQSAQAALSQSKLTSGAIIDVQYVDYTSLQGKYTLHLRVERLP